MSDFIEAKLDGDEIIIRLPREYITDIAVPAAFDYIAGYEKIEVKDKSLLIKDLVSELNRELGEDGTTIVHKMLDRAIRQTYDNGSEAFSEK